jgi:2'-5' RNA ligase
MPRVFIAVSAPGNDAIEGVVATLSGMGRAVKAVALNNLHLTLRFIGQVEEGQMEPIASAVHDAVADHRHAELPLIGLGAFPNRQRPQTIWIGIRGQEPLATIVQDIELALIDVGIEPDERPFHAHLTVARVKTRPPAELFELLEQCQRAAFGTLDVLAVDVMLSTLTPQGPVYTVSHRAALRV